MIDHDQVRVGDSSLSITVNNDQYRSTLGREYTAGVSQHFRQTEPASQYVGSYKDPLPAPVTEIVHQTGRLLSQVDEWHPISLQPSRDTAPASSQSAVSQPLLVNISNSKYTTLNASSSLAQSLLKNLDKLGKAFSSSTVTYNPVGSVTATSGSTFSRSIPPSTAMPYVPGNTGYGNRAYDSSGRAVSSKQAGLSAGESSSLKYVPTCSSGDKPHSTAVTSTHDPVIANVLKSIGFNFDVSEFGCTAPPKEREPSYPSSVPYSNIVDIPPQPKPVPPPRSVPTPQPVPVPQPVPPVQGADLLQSRQNLNTSSKASTLTEYDTFLEKKKTFTEIDKVLQKVREYNQAVSEFNKRKLRSKSPEKDHVRSRSRHRSSSSEGGEDNRRADKRPQRSADRQEQKGQRHVGNTDAGERHSRTRATSSPQRHDSKKMSPSSWRSNAKKASPSPRRHDSRKKSLSPRRLDARKASPSPRQRNSRKKSSPRRRDSRRSSPSPRRHDARKSSPLPRPHHTIQALPPSPRRYYVPNSPLPWQYDTRLAPPLLLQHRRSRSPPQLLHDPRARMVPERMSYSQGLFSSSPPHHVGESVLFPKFTQPLQYPAYEPMYVEDRQVDAQWERSIDDFLHKVHGPRQSFAAPSALQSHKRRHANDVSSSLSSLSDNSFSSISSGSLDDDDTDKSTRTRKRTRAARQQRTRKDEKRSDTAQCKSQDSLKRSVAAESGQLRASADHSASNVKSSTDTKVCRVEFFTLFKF